MNEISSGLEEDDYDTGTDGFGEDTRSGSVGGRDWWGSDLR